MPSAGQSLGLEINGDLFLKNNDYMYIFKIIGISKYTHLIVATFCEI